MLVTPTTPRKAVVIGVEHPDEILSAAIAVLLKIPGIYVEGQDPKCGKRKNEVRRAVARSKRVGNPVFIRQGPGIGPYLKALGCKGYWMYRWVGARKIAFLNIAGKDGPPTETVVKV